MASICRNNTPNY